MNESAGRIYFEVDADTQKLLDSVQPTEVVIDKFNRVLGRTDKAADSASMQLNKTAQAVRNVGSESNSAAAAMNGLYRKLAGILTLQGANVMIQMAEGYREMGERIRFATSSQEEYEMVQARLLKTANGTYRALSEAQEVYILTADSLRSMGYSTDQALDITDSLSYAFVKNAASAERGANATRAYANSIMKGKVDSNSWQTIMSTIPSVIQDIANASGKSAEEVRRLGAEGKLTAKMLNEGLRQSLDSNKAAADGMATTVRDAFTNMRNSLSVFLGESSAVTGSTKLLSDAIVLLGNNISTVVAVLGTAGAGALSLYIAKTGAAALSSAKAMLAARAEAAENLRLAQARVAATQAALAHARANAGLTGSFATLTAAENANTAATTALAGAKRAAAASGATLMGVLGGPVGIAAMLVTAAAGMYAFRDGGEQARKTLQAMEQPLEDIIKKFRELDTAQRAEMLVQNTKAKAQAAEDAEEAFRKLYNSISSVNALRTDWSVAQWRSFREEVVAAKDAGKDLTPIIQRAARESGLPQEAIDSWIELNAEVFRANGKLARAKEVSGELTAESQRLAQATREAAAGQRELNDALAGFEGESGDALKKLQERVAAMHDGNSEAKKAARYLETLTDVSEEFKTAYMSAALAMDAATEAKRRNTEGAKAGVKAAEEQKKAEEENAKTIAKMAETLYQAGLAGEALAVTKARASLNKFATASEVEQIEAMARAIWKIEEATKARDKFGTGKDADKYIMGQDDPLRGGAFDNQLARYEAEARLEEERYAAQLARIKEARELQVKTHKDYDTLEEEAARTHAQKMAQIEQAKADTILASSGELFGALADAVKNYAGESSGAYKAMFAVSKAFAIAQATLNMSTAISQAMADPSALTPAQKFANMAAIAAAGGQLVSAISGASFGGGRQHGGNVSAGKFYRINETGAPEILNTNGKQYLMMNQSSGRVTPMTSSGSAMSSGVNVSITINSDGSSQVDASSGMDQFGRTIGEFVRSEFQKMMVQANRQGGSNWQYRDQ